MSDVFNTNEFQQEVLNEKLDKKGQDNFDDVRQGESPILSNATDTQKALIEDNINKKTVYESLPYQKNYTPFTNYFDIYENSTDADEFKKAHPYSYTEMVELARKNLLSTDDITDENKLKEINLYNSKVIEAKKFFNQVHAYNSMTEKQIAGFNDFYTLYKQQNSNLSDDVINRLYVEKAMKTTKEMFDENGIIRKDILDNPLFMANMDPDTYKNIANAYNIANDSYDYFSGYAAEKYRRVLDLQLTRGEIDNEQYEALTNAVNSRYTVEDENDTLKTMGQIVSGMVQPYADNKLLSITAIGTSLFARGSSIGASVAFIPSAIDMYQREQATQYHDLWLIEQTKGKNKRELDREEVARQTRLSSLAQAGIEFVADKLLFGILKPTEKLLGKGGVTTKILDKLGQKKGLKDAAERAKQALRENKTSELLDASKDIATLSRDKYKYMILKGIGMTGVSTAIETGTEVAQDVIHDYTVNTIAGKDYTLSDAYNNATQTINQVSLPIFVLMALGHGVKTTADIAISESRSRALVRNIEKMIASEMLSDTKLAKEKSEINGEIIDNLSADEQGVFFSRIYFNPQQVKTELKNNGINPDTLDQKIKDKLFKKPDYETDSITGSQYASLPENVRLVLQDIVTDKDGKMYSDDIRRTLSDEKLRDIALRFEQQEEFKVQNKQALNDFHAKVYNAFLNNKIEAKIAARLANLYTAFVTAMSNQTGLSAKEIISSYSPKFKDIKSATPKDITAPHNTKASYNPKDRVIAFDSKNDFESSLHESAHFFLDVVLSLMKDDKLDKSFADSLSAWYKKDVTKIKPNTKEYEVFQEQFVAAFIHGLATGDVKSSGVFRYFKNYLTNLNTSDLFNAFNLAENTTTDEYLKNGFEQTYQANRIKADSSFNTFINSLFVSEMQGEIARQESNVTELLKVILDSDVFNEDEKAQFVTALETVELSNEKIQDEMNKLMLDLLLLQERDKGDISKYLQKFYAKHPELHTDEMTQKVMSLLDKYKKYIENTETKNNKNLTKIEKIAKDVVKALGKSKVDVTGLDITDEQIARLNARGIKAVRDISVTFKANTLFNSFAKQLKDKNIKSATDLLKQIADELTPKERAIVEAEKLFKEDISNIADTMRVSVDKKVANIFARSGNAILKAFHNLVKDSKSLKELTDTIKRTAKAEAYRTKYSEASANSSRGNARNQAISANKEVVKGNIGQAYQHTQAMNYHLAKGQFVAEFKAEIVKTLVKVRQFVKRGEQKLSASYETDMLRLNNLLAYKLGIVKKPKFDLSNIDIEELKTKCDPELIDTVVSYINGDTITYYKDMTLGDLLQVRDMIQSVIDSARSAKVVEINGKTTEMQEVHDKMIKTLSDFKTQGNEFEVTDKGGVSTFKKKSKIAKIKDELRKYKYLTTIVEMFCQRLDGKIVGGPFHDMYQMVRNAVTNRNLINHRLQTRLKDALSQVKCKVREPIECYDFKFNEEQSNVMGGNHLVLGIGEYKNRVEHQLIGILLHLGTNYNAFINSTFEGKTFAEKELVFQKWFARMTKQGIITKEIMDCCQAIWDIYADLEHDVVKASKQMRGYAMNILDKRDFAVKFADDKTVIYRGGYVPAIENKDITRSNYNTELNLNENVTELQRIAGLRNPSFTKDRSVTRNKALCFDPVMLINRTTDVMNYAYILPAVVQVNKILQHDNIRNILNDKMPDAYKEVFEPFLYSCATMSSMSGKAAPFMSALVKLNRRFVNTLMFVNATNVLQQYANIIPIFTHIGGKYVLKHLSKTFWLGDTKQRISEMSDFMKTRFAQTHDSLSVIETDIMADPNMFESKLLKAKAIHKKTTNFFDKNYYVLYKIVQDHIDAVAWCAAYEKSLAESDVQLHKDFANRLTIDTSGNPIVIDSKETTLIEYNKAKEHNKQMAIKYADSIVRTTQSSYDIPDMAKISKGSPLQKLVATFGNYFYTMENFTETAYSLSKRNAQTRSQLLGLYTRIFLTSGIGVWIVAELIRQVVGTGDMLQWDDNDDEVNTNILLNLALAKFKGKAVAKPVVGNAVVHSVDKWVLGNVANDSLISAPGVTGITNTVDGIINFILFLLGEKELKGSAIQNLGLTVSAITGLSPLYIVSKAGKVGYDLSNYNISYSDIDYKYLEFIRSVLGSYSDVTKVK